MDVTDIGKVASRKRMNTDAEKLREKVSRETAKIIKLKVAQDTAYWDLKERLQQLQGAHERLQQNMVDVQMQHEHASASYARELRHRPDTLNKLAGARGVCDVLEEFCARLRRCVARTRADTHALQAAYGSARAAVTRVATQRDAARGLAERHAAQARRLEETREQLGAARARADERAAAAELLGARLRHADEAAAALRDEVARLLQQFDAQVASLQQSIARRDAEVEAAREDTARARGAAEERAGELRRALQDLADAKNTIERLNREVGTRVDEIKNLEEIINEKKQHEQVMEAEICSMKQCIDKLEAEKVELSEQLSKSVQECEAERAGLASQRAAAAQLQQRLADCLAQRDAQGAEHSRARAELQRELDASTGTIARLMTDLRAESDARARADAALGAARRQQDAERDAARALELQLRDRDQACASKDDELNKQMTIILDMRAEKERLQERIQGMQNTIDNIQKELTGRLAAPKGGEASEPAELDAGPLEPHDATLYNFLSDGSVDGDALDPREVGRRFEALSRGPRLRAQVKDDLKIKSRAFFKNKRFDGKLKKFK